MQYILLDYVYNFELLLIDVIISLVFSIVFALHKVYQLIDLI